MNRASCTCTDKARELKMLHYQRSKNTLTGNIVWISEDKEDKDEDYESLLDSTFMKTS